MKKDQDQGIFYNLSGHHIEDGKMECFVSGMIATKRGVPVHPFEYMSKSQNNAFIAMTSRHCGSDAEIDTKALIRFREFSALFWEHKWPILEAAIAHSFDTGDFDPKAWLDGKDWDDNKKLKYAQTMTKHIRKSEQKKVRMVKSFTTMVKAGEQYYSDKSNDSVLMQGVSERPRNIFVPPDENCGFLVYIQSLLWAPLRIAIPGFIQGYQKKDYVNWMQANVKNDWASVSIDGSAFDSTQFAELMDLCEN